MVPSCGHVGVPTATEFHAKPGNTGNAKGNICINCYRQRDADRHRGPGGQPRATKPAGHKVPKRPKVRVPSDIKAARGMIRDWEAQQRKNAQGYVYCIGDGTAVKIGYSVAPAKRVPELQTGNPRILTLLGFIKGTEADERALHRKYRKDNILQEWFRPSPALLSEFGISRGPTMICPTPDNAEKPNALVGSRSGRLSCGKESTT